jgi:hypothetical protein
MAIRPHRDAGPDGVTVITQTQDKSSGFTGFTDAELIPHTDGSAVPSPPGLLLLVCQQAADEGGSTRVADGARAIKALADQHPASLDPLSAPQAAFFGTAGAYLGAPLEPAGPGRMRIRLRLDDLAWFSTQAAGAIPLLRTAIAAHTDVPARRGRRPATQQYPLAARPRQLCRPPFNAPHPRRPPVIYRDIARFPVTRSGNGPPGTAGSVTTGRTRRQCRSVAVTAGQRGRGNLRSPHPGRTADLARRQLGADGAHVKAHAGACPSWVPVLGCFQVLSKYQA